MTAEQKSQIPIAYSLFEDSEPDISTERLLQMVADFCGCDIGDVVDVLMERTEGGKVPL